jgi:RNA polymerase sigma factor (sigma-70 family)
MESVEFLLSHQKKLIAFVRKRVGDADLAEDLFQDALLRAVRSAPDEEEDRLLSWFYRVLRNAVIDHYRRAAADSRRIEAVASAMPEEQLSAEAEGELCACFVELLPSLKPEYREMIESLELKEEPPESAAKRLGIDRNNLKVRRFRARQQLRERLEEACRICAKHGCLDCTCKGEGHSK